MRGLSKSEAFRISRSRHVNGAWATWKAPSPSRLVRLAAHFISFKRAGISHLAKRTRPHDIGLDSGAGNGAYAHWLLDAAPCTVVALDWTLEALRAIEQPLNGKILRVCADACHPPFRDRCFDFFYTIDALGHIPQWTRCLDELERMLKPNRPFFVHSECADYRGRWPDRMLIKTSGRDSLALLDGHLGLALSKEIQKALVSRFVVESFFSPAGLLGWMWGYPEKYRKAFDESGKRVPALLTQLFAVIKRAPVAGALLRVLNACSNRFELLLGLSGGGSCFARGRSANSE
jgi:ubiquinone/menaquinone biosynthesis C-methylase UbiE